MDDMSNAKQVQLLYSGAQMGFPLSPGHIPHRLCNLKDVSSAEFALQ
jgi:hypothetical protein